MSARQEFALAQGRRRYGRGAQGARGHGFAPSAGPDGVHHDRGAGEERDLFTLDLAGNGKPHVCPRQTTRAARASLRTASGWPMCRHPRVAVPRTARSMSVPFPTRRREGCARSRKEWAQARSGRPKAMKFTIFVATGPIPVMAVQLVATPTTITPTSRRQLFSLRGRFDLTRTSAGLGYAAVYDVMPKSGDFVAVLSAPLKPPGQDRYPVGHRQPAAAAHRPELERGTEEARAHGVIRQWSCSLKQRQQGSSLSVGIPHRFQ